MVSPGDDRGCFEQFRLRAVQDMVPDLGVLGDHLEFIWCEAARLEQYVVRRSDFADVVHRAGCADQLALFRV